MFEIVWVGRQETPWEQKQREQIEDMDDGIKEDIVFSFSENLKPKYSPQRWEQHFPGVLLIAVV